MFSLLEWGHHEENRRWNRSDPRDPEPCRLCAGRQGQSATAGRDQGLARPARLSPCRVSRSRETSPALDCYCRVGLALVLRSAVEGGDHVIIVVGLAFEARIAAGPGVHVIRSGDGRNLAAKLTTAIAETRTMVNGCPGIISFGVAGGLAPHLRPGTCVVGSAVISGSTRMPIS